MNFYLARQPIFNQRMEVVAYELLYRSNQDNFYQEANGNFASSEILCHTFLELGLDTVTRGRKAFINFTKDLLDAKLASLLPKENIVVEILETVKPDNSLLEICKELKSNGYTIALDDFVFSEDYKEILPLTDIIKIDFQANDPAMRGELIQKINQPNIIFLAEKVETQEEFQQALKLGYRLFQGYFFQKPAMIKRRRLRGNQFIYMDLIKEVNSPNAQINKLEALLKRDTSLSFKLLKYINSAYYGFKIRIMSLRQALTLLGINEMRRWIILLTLQELSSETTDELLVESVIRAFFCKSIALRSGNQLISEEYFLAGLLSFLDVFLNTPMEELLSDLPLSNEITQALTGKDKLFSTILETLNLHETEPFHDQTAQANQLDIDITDISVAYINALKEVGRATS